MAQNQMTPGASTTASQQAGATLQRFDLNRFGQEVAGEIGIDPNNLGAYGLSEAEIRRYEDQTHSGTQRGGSR
ncbi:MAG: hypothetical protein K0R39_2230 [Symbiobacteriaceae bacterium]|jgi:hypothetical protein|nr:hypothetical protein [Symbiobacteriaceae bacterium]